MMVSLVLAALVAAAAAFLGNRLLFSLQDRWALITLVPLWEEACKGVAVWALPGGSVLPVHLLFGLLEFGYAAWRGERFLGLVGFTIHGMVGGVAAWVVGSGLGPYGLAQATLSAGLLHLLLNLAVVGLVFPTLGLPGLFSNLNVDPRLGGRYNERE